MVPVVRRRNTRSQSGARSELGPLDRCRSRSRFLHARPRCTTLDRSSALKHALDMSLLLPQSRDGVVHSIRLLDIHGDRYVDLALSLADYGSAPVTGRIGASECPPDLKVGDRVSVHFTMGVMTRITRL